MDTQNDYGFVWMSPSPMTMQEGSGGSSMQQVPSDMMSMDQSHSQLDSPYYPMQQMSSFDGVGQQPLELNGYLMMDELVGDYYNEPPRFMTAATQTQARRKIQPVKHPGLKLQTPIAYKVGTDPNVIPIQKDGLATCAKCGAMGVRHAFYTRHRKYCSMACARAAMNPTDGDMSSLEEDFSKSQDLSNSSIYKYPASTEFDFNKELVTTKIEPLLMCNLEVPSFNLGPGIGSLAGFPFPNFILPDDSLPPVEGSRGRNLPSYDWLPLLANPDFIAAPVNCFKHAPMSDSWDNITVGMKVEVENSECEYTFWVATVVRIAGYKVLLRYEGFENSDHDFWLNLCYSSVHFVGWCATRGKPLIPPASVAEKYKDCKEFLVERLTGAQTLPASFYSKIQESLKSRFRVGMNVEAIDKYRLRQVRLATVRRILGKRLHVTYYNERSDCSGFWLHEDSALLHPVGWASRVGHEISAPPEYLERCESGVIEKDDALDELFTAPFQSALDFDDADGLVEGMKLEAIDPLNLSTICAASIMKVLNNGYLMIRIDKFSSELDHDLWFCYHMASPYIFPPGYCHENGIPLVPPGEYSSESFNWDIYARATGCQLAPKHLIQKDVPEHGFKPGMQLESADIMDPRLVCVATIGRVVGRLLRIHFDGWEDEYDQWLDCHSPDLYPVGWCELVSYKLEAPQTPPKPVVVKKPTGRRKKVKAKVKAPHCKRQLCLELEAEKDIHNEDSNSEHADASTQPSISSPVHSIEDHDSCFESSLPSAIQVPSPPSTTQVAAYIPRLINGGGVTGELVPMQWTSNDVAEFLRRNDCGVYADEFISKETDGPKLLSLTQDQMMSLTGNKIGPTLKILNLIAQLKTKATKSSVKKTL